MIEEFKSKERHVDLSNDKMALQRLKRSGREGKEGAVFRATTTNINLPFITANADWPEAL